MCSCFLVLVFLAPSFENTQQDLILQFVCFVALEWRFFKTLETEETSLTSFCMICIVFKFFNGFESDGGGETIYDNLTRVIKGYHEF